ncbi:aromatic-ring hydroxylase C-terminal domain-containing protein [Streptomyces misionensis]|uniref:aromatic-ring hydroxylase C-terminal domain-containing protein n=1 Tax=Streptomyces misionensis TaxID=67331 RepID=UPI0036AB29B2
MPRGGAGPRLRHVSDLLGADTLALGALQRLDQGPEFLLGGRAAGVPIRTGFAAALGGASSTGGPASRSVTGCGRRVRERRNPWTRLPEYDEEFNGRLALGARPPGAGTSTRALLPDFTDAPELRVLAEGYAGRVDTLTAGCSSRPELAAVLVRPDGFTAWAVDAGAQAPFGLAEALEEWSGVPEGAVTPG